MSVPVMSLLLDLLPQIPDAHVRGTDAYRSLESALLREISSSEFGPEGSGIEELNGFGRLLFPYHSMGNISSLHLFGLDEIILFSYYRALRAKYRRVADLGANIGLHSVMMSKCGWEVVSFEPDPEHLKILEQNVQANKLAIHEYRQAAVADHDGTMTFVRVKGNTTGSHLEGSKLNTYGDVDRFRVDVIDVRKLSGIFDLLKIDIEGQEAKFLNRTEATFWTSTDAFMEVGSSANRDSVFESINRLSVEAYSQKIGWRRVNYKEDLPEHHSEGSVFLTSRSGSPRNFV